MFTLLTWARTNETWLAAWDEFEGLDMTEPLWPGAGGPNEDAA
jgi:hypothetical protein